MLAKYISNKNLIFRIYIEILQKEKKGQYSRKMRRLEQKLKKKKRYPNGQ